MFTVIAPFCSRLRDIAIFATIDRSHYREFQKWCLSKSFRNQLLAPQSSWFKDFVLYNWIDRYELKQAQGMVTYSPRIDSSIQLVTTIHNTFTTYALECCVFLYGSKLNERNAWIDSPFTAHINIDAIDHLRSCSGDDANVFRVGYINDSAALVYDQAFTMKPDTARILYNITSSHQWHITWSFHDSTRFDNWWKKSDQIHKLLAAATTSSVWMRLEQKRWFLPESWRRRSKLTISSMPLRRCQSRLRYTTRIWTILNAVVRPLVNTNCLHNREWVGTCRQGTP